MATAPRFPETQVQVLYVALAGHAGPARAHSWMHEIELNDGVHTVNPCLRQACATIARNSSSVSERFLAMASVRTRATMPSTRPSGSSIPNSLALMPTT